MTPEELRKQLVPEYRNQILDFTYPDPYVKDINKVKAILLGCDPSNSHTHDMNYVFTFGQEDNRFKKFRQDWIDRLFSIGLGLDNVYVQNLCRNYFKDETSNNKVWKYAASLWIPELKKELSVIHPGIPILLTSELLYKVLLNDGVPKHGAAEFYNDSGLIPVSPEDNKLERPLIPFYRHFRYDINKPIYNNYRAKVTDVIQQVSGELIE